MKTSFMFGERLWLSPDFPAVLFCALLSKVLQVNCACCSHLRIKPIEGVWDCSVHSGSSSFPSKVMGPPCVPDSKPTRSLFQSTARMGPLKYSHF